MNKNSHPAKTNSQSKEVFAFYIGIDLGDKYSDVCVFDAGAVPRRIFPQSGLRFLNASKARLYWR